MKSRVFNDPASLPYQLERWGSVMIAIGFFTIWEWQVHAGNISELFFPAPTVILKTLSRWIRGGELTPHLAATLARMFGGFFTGGTLGLLAGLLMGWSERLRRVFDPLFAAIHPIPKISILPLVMILFGIGNTSKIVLVAIATFFPIMINTMAGVRQIQPLYFDVAANYGAGAYKVFTRIVIPGGLPLILTGIRLALNTSLVLTIAVELVSAQQGLGALIWLAWETLRTEELYASLTVTAALGISGNLLIKYLTNRLIPWQKTE
ncbi:MAG: ABC transporter permease [bacterium]|nr:ABC transporter permease [bacterium]